MTRKHGRQRLFLFLLILLALMTLLTSFAAVLHDDTVCDHEYCPLCGFLHHKNDALQLLAAVFLAPVCSSIIFFCLGARKKIVLPTPVYLKVRMDN